MNRYFLRVLVVRLRQGRALFVLTLFGVALGVASVISIQVINRSAVGAFGGAVRAVSGESDLSLLGVRPTMPESLLAEVLGTAGVEAAWPVYRVDVAVIGRDDTFLEVIGLDVYAPSRIPWQGDPGDLSAALATPGWVAISPALARELGLAIGDRLEVSSGTRRAQLVIGALVDFQKLTPLASRKLVVMDIAQAQHALGRPGSVDQIDVRLADGAELEEVRDAIEKRVAGNARVLTPEQRTRQTEGLLSAFNLNLTAMSLISLVVGFFLILSATQASLVRRRPEFGLLRALGATRRQVLAMILGEASLLGLLGVAVGLPLGYGVAAANLDVVSTSLSNLYLIEEIEKLELPPSLYALALVMGVGGALAGSLIPALDMSRRDTKTLLTTFSLHERVAFLAPHLFAVGISISVLMAVWFVIWGHDWKPGGFVLAFGMLLSLPLLTPLALRTLAAFVRVRSFGFAYSLKSLSTKLQTSALAISALAIAVSMMVGITIMIGSFRETVRAWVGSTIRADVYITSKSWKRAGSDAVLGEALLAELATWPGVQHLGRLRRFATDVHGTRVFLNGFDLGGAGGQVELPLMNGRLPAAGGDQPEVVVSEPFFRHFGLGAGDSLVIPSARDDAAFSIVGVYYDYSPEGEVSMDLKLMDREFDVEGIGSVALYLESDRDVEQVVDALKALPVSASLEIRSNRAIRREVFEIFDQTFAITRILEIMGLLVATSGIALTLLVLARERLAELALMGALGARRRQIFRVYVGKGLAMTVIGIVLGLAGGVMLAAVLVLVINRAYFGWTIQGHWPAAAITEQLATIVAAAVLASIYPALRASRTPATELSRDDL